MALADDWMTVRILLSAPIREPHRRRSVLIDLVRRQPIAYCWKALADDWMTVRILLSAPIREPHRRRSVLVDLVRRQPIAYCWMALADDWMTVRILLSAPTRKPHRRRSVLVDLVRSQPIAYCWMALADDWMTGPYNVEYQNFCACKGPKAKNDTVMTMSMDENAVGIVNFTFFADTKFDEIKIYVHNIKDNKKNFLWSYKLNEPCKHYSVAYIIKQNLKAENCFIKKGFYNCNLNFKEVTSSYLGPSFFYGSYFFKAYLTSKKGNIGCFDVTVVLSKKK
ncbi:Uncharacterized protein OBRU01_19747 [Operophtera brumata]|uniref:Uncharacterized protein n=1 Tax=Operophtera brumata TaxID=104452 RepID=A0A0L7KNB7_OPEBR|nr:Uncharacterized protein OBRU01_19747 [Operophtera brumata]